MVRQERCFRLAHAHGERGSDDPGCDWCQDRSSLRQRDAVRRGSDCWLRPGMGVVLGDLRHDPGHGPQRRLLREAALGASEPEAGVVRQGRRRRRGDLHRHPRRRLLRGRAPCRRALRGAAAARATGRDHCRLSHWPLLRPRDVVLRLGVCPGVLVRCPPHDRLESHQRGDRPALPGLRGHHGVLRRDHRRDVSERLGSSDAGLDSGQELCRGHEEGHRGRLPDRGLPQERLANARAGQCLERDRVQGREVLVPVAAGQQDLAGLEPDNPQGPEGGPRRRERLGQVHGHPAPGALLRSDVRRRDGQRRGPEDVAARSLASLRRVCRSGAGALRDDDLREHQGWQPLHHQAASGGLRQAGTGLGVHRCLA
mmetsp:Transcript_116931/g.376165  ORF Transcript_116931/g.376165 Transcript_116931/m.376165 type:complete len:369 (+) Transcript_116931:449-1555(+)